MSDSKRTHATVAALAAHKQLDPTFLRQRFGLRDGRRGVEIPYYAFDGSLSRSRLRRYTETAHPTEWLAGDGTRPYFDRANRKAAHAHRKLVIVEGETDVWALTAHDIPALGVPGATMAKVISRDDVAKIPHLLVVREPDAGGARFGRDVCRHLRELAYAGEVLVIDLQATCGAKDPAALHARDPEGFEAEWARAVEAAIEAERAAAPTPSLVNDAPGELIDGGALLDELTRTYRRFVLMSPAQIDALALYVLHTHAIDAADVTPYPLLRSPEKRCGKTRTLLVSQHLCRSVVLAANVTAAALYRLIDAEQPTYMIDEVDTIYGGHKSERNEDIRAILNAGHQRGATVPRCVGDQHRVELFAAFCPKMLAGLRCRLPDTILDRCIVFEMERKPPGAGVERFRRRRTVPELHAMRDRAVAWAAQNIEVLKSAEPELPDELNDRAQDVWEPLFAIADRVGGEWPARARRAALVLSGGEAAEDESLGARLLADVRAYFDATGVDRAASATLAKYLSQKEDAPWGPRFGRDFDARRLASLLEPYGIGPHGIRIDDKTPRGYLRDDFTDAWKRYAPSIAQDRNERNKHNKSEAQRASEELPKVTVALTNRNTPLKRNGKTPPKISSVADVADVEVSEGATRPGAPLTLAFGEVEGVV